MEIAYGAGTISFRVQFSKSPSSGDKLSLGSLGTCPILNISTTSFDVDISSLWSQSFGNGMYNVTLHRGTSSRKMGQMQVVIKADDVEELKKYAVVEVDKKGRVKRIEEKPEKPRTNLAVPPFYIYKKEDLPLIRDCMNHGCGFDAPGNLAHYLVDKTTVHAWQMPGSRFDIGSMDSYEEAQRKFV
jgi:dTDP-glucose pyrophosphorylase